MHQARRALLRDFFAVAFAPLAVLLAGLDFWLLDFLAADLFAVFLALRACAVRVLAALDLAVRDLAVRDLAAPAFLGLAAGALRRCFVARFRRAGAAAVGGTISGSDTRPSAASGT
ncbi:hypothetical protein LMTR3_29515 [Bradyrhizobium sp. LMTR 3]|nr:hypothetical protein LMTR3_29515 [Bradyrhizobium sp. LMTR 3]